jgi:hypothetical protein
MPGKYWYGGLELERPQRVFENHYRWAFRLMLVDGLARRMEEIPWKRIPPVYRSWAGCRTDAAGFAGIIRQKVAALIHALVPYAELSSRERKMFGVSFPFFAEIYAKPLFTSTNPPQLETGAEGIFQTELPPPLSLLLAQTGLPHVLIAARTLATVYPLQDGTGQLHPVWALFYQRQLLEWELRRKLLLEVREMGNAKGLPLADHWLDPDGDLGISRPVMRAQLAHILWGLDNGELVGPLEDEMPLELLYQVDWFERSLSPESAYRRRRMESGKPKSHSSWTPPVMEWMERAWSLCPDFARYLGLLLEQHLILACLSPLEPLFLAFPTSKLTRELISPYGPAVWMDWETVNSGR